MIERYRISEIEKIWSDENKFREWLNVEIAVMEAMAKKGLISEKAVIEVKKKGKFQIERIREIEKTTNHDVIAFITNVAENVGKYGRYIHKGLTSSDVIDTANALLITDVSKIIKKEIKKLKDILKKQAIKYRNLICIGRTHGQHAEPTTMGLRFLSFYSELARAEETFNEAVENIKYGKISGAVGNFAHLPPVIERIALRKLGLNPEPVSTQIVPRDRYLRYIFAIAVIGTAIERVAMEVRHLSRTEIGELQEPFARGQKGSSAMPHKKNPIICERVCGMARLLRGYIMPAFENTLLWNERDISHSSVERIILPDSTQLVVYMMRKMEYVFDKIVVNEDRVKENLNFGGGVIFSQDILIALVDKGLSRDEAYKIVQKTAHYALEHKVPFTEIINKDKGIKKYLSDKELKKIFSLNRYKKNVDYIFKRTIINE